MIPDVDERGEWHFGRRWYGATVFSDVHTRDGLGLELDDLGPAPGRGLVVEAFRDDTTGHTTFTCLTTEPLPFELIEKFVVEARRTLL